MAGYTSSSAVSTMVTCHHEMVTCHLPGMAGCTQGIALYTMLPCPPDIVI